MKKKTRKQNINKKKCQIATSLYSVLMSKEEKRREEGGRTFLHGGDTGCIPLRERFAERRGRVKRYIQSKQKDQKLYKRKKVIIRRTIWLIIRFIINI